MGLRTHNEPVTTGERAFVLASTITAIEEGDTPIKLRNFSSKKKAEGGKS